jgi:hypothetical protein
MDQRSVVAWLSSLTDKQIVEFFYEAVSERTTSEIDGECGHFVMANTSKLPDEKRDTVFLALPDPAEYSGEWADDCAIYQTGQCIECGSWVRSFAKHVICPICVAKVYCT